MITIMFNFFPDTSVEKQDEILTEINNTWGTEIIKARSLSLKKPRLRHMCCVFIDSEDSGSIIERLSALSEIESAFIPAERRLVS